jgi:DNA-binding NarL/FixJ family response regulator
MSTAHRVLPQAYRVVVADPHGAAREAIGMVLFGDGGFEPAGSAATMEDAIRLIRERRPHVFVVDPWLFGASGLPGCLAARQLNPQLVIIALLPDEHTDDYRNAARAMGVDAAVKKSRVGRDLVPAIRSALHAPPAA